MRQARIITTIAKSSRIEECRSGHEERVKRNYEGLSVVNERVMANGNE